MVGHSFTWGRCVKKPCSHMVYSLVWWLRESFGKRSGEFEEVSRAARWCDFELFLSRALKGEQECFVINALPDQQLVKSFKNWSEVIAFLGWRRQASSRVFGCVGVYWYLCQGDKLAGHCSLHGIWARQYLTTHPLLMQTNITWVASSPVALKWNNGRPFKAVVITDIAPFIRQRQFTIWVPEYF